MLRGNLGSVWPHDADEAAVEKRISLNEQRIGSVLSVLRAAGARSVVDLGCGEGRLLAALEKDVAFSRIAGLDVSHRRPLISFDYEHDYEHEHDGDCGLQPAMRAPGIRNGPTSHVHPARPLANSGDVLA